MLKTLLMHNAEKIIVKNTEFGMKVTFMSRKCYHLTTEHMSVFKATKRLKVAIFTILAIFQGPKSAP